jgi:phosphatidylserine synthase
MVALIYCAPYQHDSYLMAGVGMVASASIAYLMVSTIEFMSIKQFKFTGMKMRMRIFIGAIIVMVWIKPALGLLTLSTVYVASGPYITVRRRLPRWLGGYRS